MQMKLVVFFAFTLFCYVSAVTIQVYKTLPSESISHCVRRLNETSAVGCSSNYYGNIGNVEVIFNISDFEKKLSILKTDTIVILSTHLFINVSLHRHLFDNKFVTGILVFEVIISNSSTNAYQETPFSEDYKYPNKEYSFFLNNSFNPVGSEFAFKNWPIPIAMVGSKYKSVQDEIIGCYKKFNLNPNTNRRCALEIRNFMAAVRSAKVCEIKQNLQDRFAGLFHPIHFCNDHTGMNYMIHSIDSFENRTRSAKSVIVLVSRIDSLSMFERSAFSVNGAITSASVMLSVMRILSSQKEFKTGESLKKDVLFLFIDNESYDYLGSSRFFMDLASGNIAKSSSVPINASHFDFLLEFGELGFLDYSDVNLFYPVFGSNESDIHANNRTTEILSNLSKHLQNNSFQNISSLSNLGLPPSSAQFFLRKHRPLPTIILSDHRRHFYNNFYNSFLDKYRQRNVSDELNSFVKAIASFVFQEATGKAVTPEVDESSFVSPNDIIHCFAENLECDLLKQVWQSSMLAKLNSLGTPIPTQAHSASEQRVPNDYRFSNLIQNLIIHLSGQEVNMSVCENCPKCSNLSSIAVGNSTNNNRCYKTRISAASEFSFWGNNVIWVTSSVVEKQSIRMFVQSQNYPLLIAGIVMTLLTTVLMYLINPRLADIFSETTTMNTVA